MLILSAGQISGIEKKASEEAGIPEIILMENAASAIYGAVVHIKPRVKKAAVLCGRGNNGGDGFALARKLISGGVETVIFHPEDTGGFPEAAAANYRVLKNSGADLRPYKKPYDFNGYDIIIDALFGTGLKRPLEGAYKDIVEAANRAEGFKLAADIPSGLAADSPSVTGTVFKADLTVTFSAMKICQALYPARAFCGETAVKSITIPGYLFEGADKTVFSDKNTLPPLKKRPSDTHKGDYGHAVFIGGSAGKGGAVYMASLAALKTGAGLVTGVYPEDAGACFALTPEIMTMPVKGTSYFTERGSESVARFINGGKITAFCLGNGLGADRETAGFVKKLICSCDKPAVIDADGINALDEKSLAALSGRAVITPHLGEFSRLTGVSVEEIKNRRPEIAARFAAKHNVTLVLKSAETVIASPNGKTVIAAYGSPALAKGGSGDCLAGIITGLMAQGYPKEESAELACYILGESGCAAAEKSNENSVITTDVINAFGAVLNEL